LERQQNERPPARPSMYAERLRRPLAVGSMAPDAILAHFGQLNLEAVEVLDCLSRHLRDAGELGEPRSEIGLVLPNRRQRRGIAVLGLIRKSRRSLLARFGKRRERFFRLFEIERPLGLCHFDHNSLLYPVGLHQSLAGSDGIVLGEKRGGTERKHSGSKRETDHDTSSLDCSLVERFARRPARLGWAHPRPPTDFRYSRRREIGD